MKFGLFFLGSSPRGNYRREYEEILEQCQYAEELGFTFAWLAEHHGSSYGAMSRPPVLMSAIAERTQTLRIGTAVAILPFDYPVRTAEEYAMVDVLSGGRLDFGVGRGYQPREFAHQGSDQSTSREVFSESLDIIVGLWKGEPFSYEGQHFQVNNVEVFPKPLQQPVPVMIAAISPSTFEFAAQKGFDIMTAPALMPLEDLKKHIISGARTMIQNGRTPAQVDIPVTMVVHLAPTVEQAFDDSRAAIEFQFSHALKATPGFEGKAPKGYEAYEKVLISGDSTVPPVEELNASGNVLVSDPEGARNVIRALRDDVGVKRFCCLMNTGGLEHDRVLRSMRLFAEEVMPEFGDETPVPEAFLAEQAEAEVV